MAERLAADQEDAAAARRGEPRCRSGREDHHRVLVELLAVDLDRAVERVERALGGVCRGKFQG